MEVVNWNLVRHPINWVILFLMVFFAGLLFHFVASWIKSPKTQPA